MTDALRLRLYYGFAGAAAWIAYRLLGLRRSVVRGNLRRSFPEATPAALGDIEREFVRRQGEIVAEAFYARQIGKSELIERVTLANPEVIAGAAPPRPLVLVGAHHGNFEWMLLRLSLEFGDRIVGLYKPLRNSRMDARMKAKFREAAAIGLVADQVPRTSPDKHWVEFLHQETPFYMGPEMLGRALRSKVVNVRMDRLARGRYVLVFEPLNEPGEKLAAGEITTRYARALERWIRDDPPGWWWSHRRWKLKRETY